MARPHVAVANAAIVAPLAAWLIQFCAPMIRYQPSCGGTLIMSWSFVDVVPHSTVRMRQTVARLVTLSEIPSFRFVAVGMTWTVVPGDDVATTPMRVPFGEADSGRRNTVAISGSPVDRASAEVPPDEFHLCL